MKRIIDRITDAIGRLIHAAILIVMCVLIVACLALGMHLVDGHEGLVYVLCAVIAVLIVAGVANTVREDNARLRREENDMDERAEGPVTGTVMPERKGIEP